MDDLTYRTYTLVVQVHHRDSRIELAQIDAALPADLAGRPADLLDAFAVMLRAGADRIEAQHVLPSTFRPYLTPGAASPRSTPLMGLRDLRGAQALRGPGMGTQAVNENAL